MISIIHPSRQRALQAFLTAKNWMGKANQQVDYTLSLDEDEPQLPEYRRAFSGTLVKIIVNKNRSAIDAINRGAELSIGDILIVVSDDFECEKNWDTELIKKVEGKTDWIAKTKDGIQEWVITLPIMDRVYYNRFKYIYYPDYVHMFCDTEMSCVADMLGKRINLDLSFRHNHHSVNGNKKDEISVKADNTWSQGERLFIHRAKSNFGLIGKLLPIKNESYRNWLRARI